jgi:hypothetical protein
MPQRNQSDSERLAALIASFDAEKGYQHDRWHKLDNDLTPVVNLPERLTREIGKLHGLVEGKITSVSKELERSMEAAIRKAIEPLSEKVKALETEVEDLKAVRAESTVIRKLGDYFLHLVMSAIVAVTAVMALRK